MKLLLTSSPFTALISSVLVVVAALFATPASAQFGFATNAATERLTIIDFGTGEVAATYPHSGFPGGIRVAGDLLMATSPDAGTLNIIDTRSGSASSVSIPGMPLGLAVTPSGDVAFLTDPDSNQVFRVDTAARAVTQTTTLSNRPIAIATAGDRVYVALYEGANLEVLDASTLLSVASVPVGNFPVDVAVDETRSRVWVANLFDSTVSVIDSSTNTVVSTPAVPAAPSGIEILETRGEVYVTSMSPDAGPTPITIFDASTLGSLASVGTGQLNPFDLLASADESEVWVLSLGDSDLVGIDTTTRQTTDTVILGSSHTQVAGFTPNGAVLVEIPTLESIGLIALASLLALGALRLLSTRGTPALLFAVALVPSMAESQGVSIDDGELPVADWMTYEIVLSPTDVHEARQEVSGGNPGAFRRMLHNSSTTPIRIAHEFVGADGSYDPSSSGALALVDFGWDRRIQSLDGAPAVNEAPAVFQNGQVYHATLETFSSFVWQGATTTGLIEADFLLDGTGANPDFSASGSPITFGYVRETLSFFAAHDLDNFSVCASPAGGDCVSTGGNSGVLRFASPTWTHVAGTPTDIVVQRVNGSSGEASVDIVGSLGGSAITCTLTWADGEAGGRSCQADYDPRTVEGIVSEPLRLENATGADIDDPRRALLWVTEDDPALLALFFLAILSGGWGPTVTTILLAALAILVWQRRSAGVDAARGTACGS